MRGAEPSATELNGLRSCLGQWCDKPEGITIARTSVISRSAGRGHSALSLARHYMDGPVVEGAGAPAFLYVLFYDNRLNRNAVESPRGKSLRRTRGPVPPQLAKAENPHVMLFPYPAMIYVDRSWMGGLLPHKYRRESLLHEAGHVVGLVRRESNVKDLHCPTDSCCMASVSENVKSDIFTWVKSGKPKPELCEDCAAELRHAQASDADPSTRFGGPVLVRTTPFYQVLLLPGACGLYIVDSLQTELPQFVAEWRNRDKDATRREELWVSGKVDTQESHALQALEAAKNDPIESVRKMALELERNVRAKVQGRAPHHSDPAQAEPSGW